MATEASPLLGASNGDGNGTEAAQQPPRRYNLRTALGVSGLVITLCLMAAIVVSTYPAQKNANSLTPGSDPGSVPFEAVDHPQKPSTLWGSITRPYPTGAWWLNLVVGDGDQQAVAHPYAFKTTSKGLAVSYSAYRRVMSDKSVVDIFGEDWTFGASAAVLDHYMVRYDLLTAHMYFVCAEAGSFKALLAKGSPYATVEYTRATPELKPLAPIVSVNGEAEDAMDSYEKLVSGTRFEVLLGNGQKWLIYASAPIAFNVNKSGLTAVEAYRGVLRAAFVPHGCESEMSALLDAYANGVPVAGTVTVDYGQEGEAASQPGEPAADPGSSQPTAGIVYDYTVLEWATEEADNGGQSRGRPRAPTQEFKRNTPNLLMLTLPHHYTVHGTSAAGVRNVPGSTFCVTHGVNAGYTSLKGPLKPRVGSNWKTRVPLYEVSFGAPRPPHFGEEGIGKEDLLDALKRDADAVPPTATDSYNFGKEIARLAQLVVIAGEVEAAPGVSPSEASDLRLAQETMVQTLEQALESWLEPKADSSFTNGLLFDSTYGGVVTRDGIADKQAEYGNGWYNDHHFHYGYFIYTAAVLARADPQWGDNNRGSIAALLRDIAAGLPQISGSMDTDLSAAQPAGDPLFPTARHKDWFDGHSWASGLFPQGNGKSQESSSEAVNAYYAVALYGLATHNKPLERWGRLLLSMETEAVQAYYHVPRDTEVYEPPFSAHRMVCAYGL